MWHSESLRHRFLRQIYREQRKVTEKAKPLLNSAGDQVSGGQLSQIKTGKKI